MSSIFLIILQSAHSLNSNLKRSEKILFFHWFSAQKKMHTQIQISIYSQKSARLPGEWETERGREGGREKKAWSVLAAGKELEKSWLLTCHLSVLLSVSLVSLSDLLSMSLLATGALSLLKMDTCQLFPRRGCQHIAFLHCRDLMQYNVMCSHFHVFWICFHCSPPALGTSSWN